MLWTLKARIYDRCRSLYPLSRIYRQEIDSLAQLISGTGNNANGRILDVGSGTGATLRAVIPEAKDVIAIDKSNSMLQRCIITNQAVRGVVADATALPFKPGCFDMITAVGVFEYVRNSTQVLSEIARVASASSKTILTYAHGSLLNRCRYLLGHMIYLRSDAEFAAMLTTANFVIDEQRSSLLQKQVLMHKE